MCIVETLIKDEGRIKGEKEKVRVDLMNSGYLELALKISLGEGAQEHDRSAKGDDLKSYLSQYQVKMGHVVINKPVAKGVRVIDN